MLSRFFRNSKDFTVSFPQKRTRRGGEQSQPGRNELLETRMLLTINAQEQLMVYMINRARHDPKAYQQEQGLSVDLSGYASRPPLAVNNDLFDSSEFHAQEMADHNYFNHQSAVTGDWPNKMVRDQGYSLPSFFPNDGNYVESIAAGNVIDTAAEALNLWIVDAGTNPPGHRNQLLAADDPFWLNNREIGIGWGVNLSSTYDNYWVAHLTYTDTADKFLTGVVFNDTNSNNRYDAGEGLSGVTVSTNTGLTTTTNAQGGWAIKVPTSGTYLVTSSGGAFGAATTAQVQVGTDNREVDFISGRSQVFIDFTGVPSVTNGDSVAVFRNGVFYLDGSGNRAWDAANTADVSFSFGIAGDTPISGDWNGDGKTDVGVFRNGVFYLDANGSRSWNTGDVSFTFGNTTDLPITGDWNGDGKTDVGVFRNGAFYLDANGSRSWNTGDVSFNFANASDKPITGDWNGDGKTDVGVYRSGTFYLDANGSRSWNTGDVFFAFGNATDIPVTGDWNDNGVTDVGVVRSGNWYIDANGNRRWDNTDIIFGFGSASDKPVTGYWKSTPHPFAASAEIVTASGSEQPVNGAGPDTLVVQKLVAADKGGGKHFSQRLKGKGAKHVAVIDDVFAAGVL